MFTFELCCPAEVPKAKRLIEDTCWAGVVKPSVCCDRRKGPRGDAGCWGDVYTFESCCTPAVLKEVELAEIQQSCFLGMITPEVCCDTRKGPTGDTECWSPPYTFKTCCPAEARAFRESCWVGGINADICCDLRKGPRGDNGCWGGDFTFETCCP
eukprot:gnl/TRDRNA2_/TRDRNA2_165683_c1_seq1.p2 gnl/TRDRNA2_/TRDRNA2_165683_c1~~gnl/TRDRNA2_/TRDRNA2_165683_c1_seq1.p2  ORF type:complete len:155 (+),score=27.69 gnl/TRDRNA2_/TRDRNA2_165683_c1_seq1:157-621(+)